MGKFPELFCLQRRHIGLRSWRRPLPSGAVRHQSTSRPKVKLFQSLKELSCQDLHRFILDNAKIIYSYNCLICLLFLQTIEVKSFSVRHWNPMSCSEKKLSKNLTQTFMAYCNVMVCQQTTLSGEAERPKVADAMIEA